MEEEKIMGYEKEAFRYHREPRPGKTEVVPTKPFVTQKDLSPKDFKIMMTLKKAAEEQMSIFT